MSENFWYYYQDPMYDENHNEVVNWAKGLANPKKLLISPYVTWIVE